MDDREVTYGRRAVLGAVGATGLLSGISSSLARERDDTDTTGDSSEDDEETSSPLSIDWIVADADSQTGGNLNDERVKLTNTGDTPLDLSGYRLEDAVGKGLTFADGFTLDAGASVYVHTGSGTDDADDLYMGYTREIWNDSGDTATVYDDSGTVVAQLTYDYPDY